MRAVTWLGGLVLLSVLSGCASVPQTVDRPLSEAPPSLGQAQADPEAAKGAMVRWGGTILDVKNTRDTTVIEVVARALDGSARPSENSASPGRFLMIVPAFLDPEVYQVGTAITATGQLDGVQIRTVGEYDYRYPVLRVDGHHLWPPRTERRATDYDPFRAYPWRPYWLYHPYYHPYYW